MRTELRKVRRRASALLALACLVGVSSAQTITVTTSADVVDVPIAAVLADLPGPDGVVSFREALRVSDNEPGHQTVGFAIPQSDWYLPDIFPGQCLLQASLALSAADPVTIDGTTQTAFTGDTFPGGNELVLYGLTLYLNGDGSVVTGLHDTRVELNGSSNLVHGNTGGMHVVLYSGSGSTVRDNEIGTLQLYLSNDNVVVRNELERVRITGNHFAGQWAANNRIGGPDPADGNAITGWGNYGEHGVPAGTTVELLDSSGTVIQNNTIGTTPDGTAIGNPASTVGIGVLGDTQGLLVRDNQIAIRAVGVGPSQGALYGWGMWLEGSGAGVTVVGNTIGLDAAGQPTLGGVSGIQFGPWNYEGLAGVRIGGTAPGEANEIAGHASTGVLVGGFYDESPLDVRITGNSIHGNGDLGIDLTPNSWTFGPTANDPLDADVGANALQNHPVVDTAAIRGMTMLVTGRLESEPLGAYTIELYASPACGAAGVGQGQVFLGSTSVTTDAAGQAPFAVHVPALAPKGWVVSSTATHEPVGATSEFSPCRTITRVPLRVSAGTPASL